MDISANLSHFFISECPPATTMRFCRYISPYSCTTFWTCLLTSPWGWTYLPTSASGGTQTTTFQTCLYTNFSLGLDNKHNHCSCTHNHSNHNIQEQLLLYLELLPHPSLEPPNRYWATFIPIQGRHPYTLATSLHRRSSRKYLFTIEGKVKLVKQQFTWRKLCTSGLI